MCFSFCLIIYSAVCQYSLRPVLFCKFRKIHKKTPKNGSHPRCVLVDTAKFLITSFLKNPLDSCFCINTRSVYCPTTTFCLIKNDVTHIFWPSFFSVYFVGWEQKLAQYFTPLAWSLFSNQSNIWDGAFLTKIVNSLKPLSIFVKKAPLQMFDQVLNTPL